MKPQEQIGAPRPLQEWLGDLGRLPGDGWLLIRTTINEISPSTPCYPMKYSGRDLSEEEQEQFDEWLVHSEYTRFLNEGQLQDIVSNLQLQRKTYRMSDLIEAIAYYYENDAFKDQSTPNP